MRLIKILKFPKYLQQRFNNCEYDISSDHGLLFDSLNQVCYKYALVPDSVSRGRKRSHSVYHLEKSVEYIMAGINHAESFKQSHTTGICRVPHKSDAVRAQTRLNHPEEK